MAEQELSLVRIKSTDIYVGERRRKEIDHKKLLDLALDIKENGLTHPPTVRPPNDIEQEFVKQPYVLVAGGRRLGALIYLGWPEIPVLLRETMDELRHRIIELHENIQREPMTWDEEALAKQEIMQLRQAIAEQTGEKITQAQVAVDLGISPASFSRSIAAAEAIQDMPELKKSGSRKSALRAHEVAQNYKRLTATEMFTDGKARTAGELQRQVVIADARDWIRKQQPRTVDLLLTDPPFGIDYFSQGHKTMPNSSNSGGLGQYDDSKESMEDLLVDLVPQWFRVMRETGWIVSFMNEENYGFLQDLVEGCCAEHCDYHWQIDEEKLKELEPEQVEILHKKHKNKCQIAVDEQSPVACRWLKVERPRWVWFRPNSRNRSRYPQRHAQSVYETILVCNMGRARLEEPSQNLLLMEAEYGPDRFHPHQKPVGLGKMLARKFSQIGDTVVDTSFGSGALLAGAASVGRFVLGCDNNENLWGPALGLISKTQIPAPANARKQSAAKYDRMMAEKVEGVEDFTQIEEDEDDTDGAPAGNGANPQTVGGS